MTDRTSTTRAWRVRRTTAALAVGLALAATGACSAGDDPGGRTTGGTSEPTGEPTREPTPSEDTMTSDAPTKNGSEELRTDLEPLTSRFSALGTPVAATWASGTVGDTDVPGPTTYWIDAVVTLDRSVADDLVARTSPQDAGETPDVVARLTDALPDGPYLTGDDLDAAFAESGFTARAYLDADDATVVLVTLGQ